MNSFLPNKEIEIPLSKARKMAKEHTNAVLSDLLSQVERDIETEEVRYEMEGGKGKKARYYDGRLHAFKEVESLIQQAMES